MRRNSSFNEYDERLRKGVMGGRELAQQACGLSVSCHNKNKTIPLSW